MSRRLPPRLYIDDVYGWRIRDGERRIRTGLPEKDRAGAEKALADYIAKKYQPKPGPNPLIADVLLHYSQTRVPHIKAKQNTDYNLANLAAWWAEKRASDVGDGTCRAYAAERTPAAGRRDLEVLRAALRIYSSETAAAADQVVLPPRREARDRWLTMAEARLLRKTAMRYPHVYRFVIIGLMTGTRSGAVLRMEWSWIDIDGCLMRRRAPGELEDAHKKSPPVRISRRLARLLRRWKRDGAASVIHYRGKPVRSIKKAFRAVVKTAGLKGVKQHTLRHTRATWLMQENVPVWEAAGHLGMSLETLTRIYAKHSPDFQKKASEV